MKILNKNSGSVLIQAMLVIGVTAAISGAVGVAMNQATSANAQAERKRVAEVVADGAMTYISALDKSKCGKFVSLLSAPSNIEQVLAQVYSGGVPIQMQAYLPNAGDAPGAEYLVSDDAQASMGLKVKEIRFQAEKPTPTPISDGTSQQQTASTNLVAVSGKLIIGFKSTALFSTYEIPPISKDMILNFDPAQNGKIVGCHPGMSTESVCKMFGGQYQPKKIPSCLFVPPDTPDCKQKGMYIKDYASDGTPICGTFEASCPKGYFIRGISSEGKADCEIAHLGPSPTRVPGNCGGKECDEVENSFAITDDNKKIDIMLVIDDSKSMSAENKQLSEKFNGFIQLLDDSGMDWQICYTTTGIGSSQDDGNARFWLRHQGSKAAKGGGVEPIFETTKINVFTPTFLPQEDSLKDSVGQFKGNGSGDEQGIHAISKSLNKVSAKDCFRKGAFLTSIIISDEDERSCGGRCQFKGDEAMLPDKDINSYRKQYEKMGAANDPQNLIDLVNAKYGDNKFIAHSLIVKSGDKACYDKNAQEAPAFYGKTYEELSNLTKGIIGSVCSSNYAVELQAMATKTVVARNSFTLDCPASAPNGIFDVQSVDVTPAVAGFTYSLVGDQLNFSPQLNAGSSLKVKFRCLK